MGEENAKPVYVDPRCIQEALRMYLQPIKNDDPRLDFFTMYKRETVEYDTDYMKNHNEDLNTTLIFAGLFSAVSSAFVVDIQSKLEPDSNERSEAYLRAVLLTLNRSIIPDEDPAVPPVWKGPSAEIITALDLLYASLLISLLAAFVAMLGKQWLNRYLRHTGGSIVERCGDRQRKFDGLEKWPFRLFIDSLPLMLQIALLLLACGLSRYVSSINTSVARVVISLTVLGLLFYVGIVAAGTSSYECPFQTPVSTAFRHVIDSGIVRRLLPSLIHATQKSTRELLVVLSPPGAISLIYTIWMDTWQGLVSTPRRFFDVIQNRLCRGVSPSHILSGTRSAAKKIGCRTIVLLLRVDRAFANAKQRLVQIIRRFRRAGPLPTTIEDTGRQPAPLRNGIGLLVRVRNLETLRKQNTDNVRCVCWVLRNITDPEAIDPTIRLAGTIRWFDGDPDHDPPFNLIVSTFEACFDSTKQLYPGMTDRAYFSARAILQINLGARAQSHEFASKYPIPEFSSNGSQYTNPDLRHVIRMLERNFHSERPTLDFPRAGENTHNHLLWTLNLFVDLTRAGPNPILQSYESYLSAAVTNHQVMIADTLLMWYMFLGGRVEEETFWATDKSDSLEIILSHLSARVMNAIVDGNGLEHLNFLLEFLAAWEKRPMCLTPMAYKWCSAISDVAGLGPKSVFLLRLQPQNVGPGGLSPEHAERGFSFVGPGYDPIRTGKASHHTREHTQAPAYFHPGMLLFMILEVGFRLVVPGPNQPALRLDHTPYHDVLFKRVFSTGDDEAVADGVCAWIADSNHMPAGSCVHSLAERVEEDPPFSPRLRRMCIHAIEHMQPSELRVSELETIRLLNRLDVSVNEMENEGKWMKWLVGMICSLAGLEGLSIHYWRLLEELPPARTFPTVRAVELGRLLEEAENWEKLEVWIAFAWRSVASVSGVPAGLEDLKRVTLKLLLQRPSTIPRFEDLSESEGFWFFIPRYALEDICAQARAGKLPPGPPPPQPVHTQRLVALPFWSDDTF